MASAAEKKPEIAEGYENPYISPRTKQFYLNTDSADVYFICDGNNDERIPAHKVIMSVPSDAFYAMFHGGLREPGDVRIVDASADGFKEFLKLFYFEKINLSMEHIEEVVYLCAKYVYSSSLKICERFLLDSLSIENVRFSFELAIAYDLTELEQECEKIIAENTLAVFQTDGFLECDKSVLAAILSFDTLSCFEIDLFDWCMTWVKAANEGEKVTRQLIDAHLGDSFHDIGFGSMTSEHLGRVLAGYSDLFAVDEYQEIVQLIASKDFHSVLFKEELRLFPWNNNGMIKSPVNSHRSGWRDLQEHESVTFSTNKHILLGEIVLKAISIADDTPIDLLILKKSTFDDNDGNSQIFLQQKVELTWKSHFQTVVKLHKPLLLSPNSEYEIQLNIGSITSNAYYTPIELKKVDLETSKTTNCGTITVQQILDTSLVESLNFKIISSKDYRL